MARALLAATLGAFVTGCGHLFDTGGFSGGDAPPGASIDAPIQGDASIERPPQDAKPDADAGPPFCKPTDLFCDTFDGRFDQRWTVIPVGAELVTSDATSAPYSARLAPATNINSFLRVVLTPPGGATKLSGVLDVEFALRTSLTGTGVVLGQLGFERAGESGGFQVFVDADKLRMGATFGTSTAQIDATREGTAFDRARISVTLSPDGTQKALSFNDRPTAPKVIPFAAFEPTKITLDVGFVSPPGTTNAVIFVDDVRVSLR